MAETKCVTLSGRKLRRNTPGGVVTDYAAMQAFKAVAEYFDAGGITIQARRRALDLLVQEQEDLEAVDNIPIYRRAMAGKLGNMAEAREEAHRIRGHKKRADAMKRPAKRKRS